jgi:hypothetical protein
MIEKVGGVVVAPTEPTLVPGNGRAKVIDFFIVDKVLVKAVEKVEVLSELLGKDAKGETYTVAASPHRVVRLKLRSDALERTQPTLRIPRLFPRDKPIGCARRPHVPGEGFLGALEQALERQEKVEEASKAWKLIATAMESELGGVCDLVSCTGVDPKWAGR